MPQAGRRMNGLKGHACRAEGPEHEVEITQPFYMGTTEVTVGQFRQFVEEKDYRVGDDRWKKPGFEQIGQSSGGLRFVAECRRFLQLVEREGGKEIPLAHGGRVGVLLPGR